MKLDFNKLQEERIPEFKGGTGETIARMHGRLPAGSTIGYHRHETNSEIIFILDGAAKCLYDDGEEHLVKGECHYCPKGHSHSLINAGKEELVFFAVVPEQ